MRNVANPLWGSPDLGKGIFGKQKKEQEVVVWTRNSQNQLHAQLLWSWSFAQGCWLENRPSQAQSLWDLSCSEHFKVASDSSFLPQWHHLTLSCAGPTGSEWSG